MYIYLYTHTHREEDDNDQDAVLTLFSGCWLLLARTLTVITGASSDMKKIEAEGSIGTNENIPNRHHKLTK